MKKEFTEILLVRLTRLQKKNLRRITKYSKVSEAEIMRQAFDYFLKATGV